MAGAAAKPPPRLLLFILLAASSAAVVIAGDPYIFYDWNVSYALLAPLGVHKKVIVINNEFPGPLLNTTTNDNIVVNVHNNLDQPLLFTWNGIQMRRNSWDDGVEGTNCPIMPGTNWTYTFQVKDQIGSFFYFPSVGLQSTAGGFGPIRVNNRAVIPVPFAPPAADFDVLVGDWFDAGHDHIEASVSTGHSPPSASGILINGRAPYKTRFTFRPGEVHRLRVSNVGLKTPIRFEVRGHKLLMVETEGCYTVQQYYDSVDVHVGQSYSFLVSRANRGPAEASYHMVASSLFDEGPMLTGVAIVDYPGSTSGAPSSRPVPRGECCYDYNSSMQQALSIRMNLTTGAARPNPQGSFHYGNITIERTIVIENGEAAIGGKRGQYCTVNGVAFRYPGTPLKLADYLNIPGVFELGGVPDAPDGRAPSRGTPVIDARRRSFIEIVFQNTLPTIQTWHLDGYSFFVVGMDNGKWDESKKSAYNMVDAVFRSTVQAYPNAWTAILVSLDNEGMWNLRSQDGMRRFLGQQVYMRVKGDEAPGVLPDPRDENPPPSNILKCGKAAA